MKYPSLIVNLQPLLNSEYMLNNLKSPFEVNWMLSVCRVLLKAYISSLL